jgi:hypothetical protein
MRKNTAPTFHSSLAPDAAADYETAARASARLAGGARSSMSEALFNSPEVRKVIRAVLVSKGVRDDLENEIEAVVLKCIEQVRKTGRPPADVKEAIALARAIAETHGDDQVRKRARRAKANTGSTDQADEHAAPPSSQLDPNDVKRLVMTAGEVLGSDPQMVATFQGIADGVPQNVLADEQGISHAAMRKRVEKVRKTFFERLTKRKLLVLVPAGAIAALVLWAVFFRNPILTPPDQQARDNGPSPSAIPSTVPTVDEALARKQRAAQLRAEAVSLCNQGQWQGCQDKLGDAQGLDPEGNGTPEVTATWEQANRGLEEQEIKMNAKEAPSPQKPSPKAPPKK